MSTSTRHFVPVLPPVSQSVSEIALQLLYTGSRQLTNVFLPHLPPSLLTMPIHLPITSWMICLLSNEIPRLASEYHAPWHFLEQFDTLQAPSNLPLVSE